VLVAVGLVVIMRLEQQAMAAVLAQRLVWAQAAQLTQEVAVEVATQAQGVPLAVEVQVVIGVVLLEKQVVAVLPLKQL
tara:strand:- start:1573 stop:1806 length:234 start_codon:yes stop_codon:yes gene_type:complete